MVIKAYILGREEFSPIKAPTKRKPRAHKKDDTKKVQKRGIFLKGRRLVAKGIKTFTAGISFPKKT